METSEIKKKLHDYIDTAAEDKLKAIYMVLENAIESVKDSRTKESETAKEST